MRVKSEELHPYDDPRWTQGEGRDVGRFEIRPFEYPDWSKQKKSESRKWQEVTT